MGKGGKSKGKIAFTLIAAVAGGIGGAFGGWFGAGVTAVQGALYGASIASTLWTTTHKDDYGNLNTDYSNDDYSRFNTVTNDVNQDAPIPVIYGTRKYGGLQTWTNPYNGSRYLQKDVVICEAGIDCVYDVMANEELITNDTNISIYNIQHKDATVRRSGNTLVLYAGGKTSNYTLGNTDHYDAQNSLLTTVIDRIKSDEGNGWKIDGAVDDRTSKGISANSMQFNSSSAVSCYCDPEDPERKGKVVLDNRGYRIGTFEFHQNETPDNYEDTGGYPQLAWIRADLVASSRLSGSNPTINAMVKGMKCKVWKNNKWVVEYTENPAWIIRDFLTSKRYGTGYWISEDLIDDEAFKETAAYCDEIIEYIDENGDTQTCPRYTLNIILDTQKTPIEHLSSMLAPFGGFITIGNQIALKVEKAETPVYHFTDDTIVKDSMSIGQTSLEDTPNRYKIGYFDPSLEWTETKVVVEDLEAQHEFNGQITEKTVTLAGCTSQNQALRIGRLYRDLNKVCSLTITFSVATQGMMLECGDVIEVTYGGIFTKMPFRITEIEETNAGTYSLTCRQYNASIYNDSLGAQITNPNYTTGGSPYTDPPPQVTGLEAEEQTWTSEEGILNMGLNVWWDDMYYRFLDHYQVSVSRDGETYTAMANTYENSVYLGGLQSGKYWISVQIVTADGIKGSPAIVEVMITGRDSPPGNVDELDTDLLPDGTRRFWWNFTYPVPNDITGFKLKYTQGSQPNWTTAQELHTGLVTNQPFETQALRQGVHTVMIKAVDNAGNESADVAFCILNLGDPLEDNVLWQQDLSEDAWYNTDHNGVVTEDNTVAGRTINADLSLTAHLQPMAYGQLYLLYDLNSPSTVKYCLGSGVLAWTGTDDYAWGMGKTQGTLGILSPNAYTIEDEDNEILEAPSASEITGTVNEIATPLRAVDFANDNTVFPQLNPYWRFEGMFKQYTGKVVIRSGDSLHIAVDSSPDTGTTAEIKSLRVIIDVPDRLENFDDITVPADGLTLPIKTPNYYTTAVNVRSISSNLEGEYELEVMNRTPCVIRFVRIENDAFGTRTPVEVTADITWQGYQRELI